ncbi:hypothetical protein HMPREF9628_01841 [Peptoanaerobacter stomatis]|uniref:Flavodoxin-like domain-containing protein n=1 Tax=Peptoanaerobacter stomatis TaxID=796937 RepID=G9XDG8_9FIRM|nr:FprA family A-type flavoprotein [Peptoanaerobacter stomatis]EHL19025.1 hypothetical protein HMPREF9628_01841 [Peptoanaerobacter stomatis]
MEYSTIKIQDDLYYIGVNDRHTHMFENMWPLEKGVSYNSFLMTGEKNIIIDSVHAERFEVYISKIRSVIGDNDVIDYLIINHMEPDHSSSINLLLQSYPNMKLIGNGKTEEFIQAFYKIDTKDIFIKVEDGEKLKLGEHEFTFYKTPMVHWPESMVTYYEKTKTLFSQDAFGGFGTLDGGIFDDEVNWREHEYETRRYFTNIVGKFSQQIQGALKKLSALQIDVICPVHGLIWRKEPQKIISLYDSLSKYETREGVVIAYGSMYGNTEKMADMLANTLSKNGIKDVLVYDVSKTHISHILANIWIYKGLLLGSCSYNNSLYPVMEHAYRVLEINKLKNHTLGIFGTYGWSGGGVKTLVNLPKSNPAYDFIEEVVDVKCSPSYEDFQKCIALADEMTKRIRA